MAATSPILAICIISSCWFWSSAGRLPISISLFSFGAAAVDLEDGWIGAAEAADVLLDGVILLMGGGRADHEPVPGVVEGWCRADGVM